MSPDPPQDITQDVLAIGLVDYLRHDSRPSIIVDKDAAANATNALRILFSNDAFKAIPHLSGYLRTSNSYDETDETKPFCQWVRDGSCSDDAALSTDRDSFNFYHYSWHRVITSTHIVVTATTVLPLSNFASLDAQISSTAISTLSNSLIKIQQPTKSASQDAGAHFDAADTSLTYTQLFEAHPWESTSIGPRTLWPKCLLSVISYLLSDDQPAIFYCGWDMKLIYNEAYSVILGKAHPGFLGMKMKDALPTTYETFIPALKESFESKKPTPEREFHASVESEGGTQKEVFFVWSARCLEYDQAYPIWLGRAVEVTRYRVAERRASMLENLTSALNKVNSVEGFWSWLRDFLKTNTFDLPFAMLYKSQPYEADIAQAHQSKNFTSHTVVGCPTSFIPPPKIRLGEDSQGVMEELIATAYTSHAPQIVDVSVIPWEGCAPDSVWGGFEGDRPINAVVCALSIAEAEDATALLLMGLNTRAAFDDDFKQFVDSLWRKLCRILTAVSRREEEFRLKIESSRQLEDSRREAHNHAQRLNTLLEIAPVGISYCKTTPGSKISANTRYRDMLNMRDDADNMFWLDHVFPQDKERFMEAYTQAMDHRKPLSLEVRWCRNAADKSDIRWILFESKTETLPGSTEQMMYTTAIDITNQVSMLEKERQRAEEVEAAQERFVHFANHVTTAAIAITDVEGICTYTNDAWHTLTGLPRGPVYGKEVWEKLVIEEHRDVINKVFMEAITTQEQRIFEARFKDVWRPIDSSVRGGEKVLTEKWVSACVFVESNNDGIVQSIMSCLVDISPFKWAASIQHKIASDAIQAKVNATNFIDMISHEIRNPLSVILQCGEATSLALSNLAVRPEKLGLDLETMIDNVSTIVTCAEHQRKIVSDVLTLSKLDSNLLEITPEPCEAQKTIRDTIRLYEPQFHAAEVQLRTEFDSSFQRDGQWLLLDATRLLQIIINLLTNALKFTPRGGTVTVNVSISATRPSDDVATRDEGMYHLPRKPRRDRNFLKEAESEGFGDELYLTFAITDTGCGLHDEELQRLFQRFSQASPRTHSRYGGSGLGLYISLLLIELQDGAIGVKSTPGKGSTFAFYVGTRRCRSPLSNASNASSSLQIGNASKAASSLTVLVVEDNLLNQKVLAKQLQAKGCKVYVANNGVEALDFIKTTRYWSHTDNNATVNATELSIVLLDIEMPVMDGLTCIREIRKLETDGHISHHIPVIAVSANARKEQIDQAKDAGMDDCVSKPFKVSDILPVMLRLAIT